MDEKWRDWCDEVLDPLLEYNDGEALSHQLQTLLKRDASEVDLALLAADTDRIQEYVFESAKLPEIRGGSELMRQLNEERIKQLFEGQDLPAERCILYAAGGGLLALIPASVAAELADRIEHLYPAETDQATITCAYQPVSPAEVLYGLGGNAISPDQIIQLRAQLNEAAQQRLVQSYASESHNGTNGDISPEAVQKQRGFGQMVRLMGSLLRQRKDMPAARPVIEALPFAVRCRLCQVRPAEQMFIYFEEERWPLCFVCRQKVKTGIGGAKEARSRQLEKFLEWLNDKERSELKAEYFGRTAPSQVNHPQDLNELGAACNKRVGKRYIGFIYADGNRMGQVLETLPTPRAYKRFSDALRESIKVAVYQALAENLSPIEVDRVSPTGKALGKGHIHPVEILVIGGDDLILIVPGYAAFSIAGRLCQIFEGEMKHRVGDLLPNPTLSTGVVIADSHNPVRVLQQLAKELCRSAKRRAYDEEQAGWGATSAVDFLLLKSQSMLRRDIQQLRETPPYFYPEGTSTDRGVRLTAAPYRLDEFCRLLQILKLMRQQAFSTSRLQGLVAALHKGQHYGSVHYLYQTARSNGGPKEENMLFRIAKLWQFDDAKDPIPWHQASGEPPGVFVSILPDLLELYPMVPRFNELKPADRAAALDNLWQEILQEANHAY